MSSRRRLTLAAAAAGFAALVLVAPANASTVSIEDQANILVATTVQNQAATLPLPILIWTSTQDATNRSTFDQDTLAKGSSAFPIVLGINPQSHHETLQMGPQTGLSQSAKIAAEQSANSAFDNTMKSANNYTTAVGAALTSLNSSLAARGNAGATSRSSPVRTFLTIGLIVIVLIVVIAALGRLFRSGRRGRMVGGPPMGGFNQGYPGNQGYGPQGYGPPPGYGPGYSQGGVSPGAAGAMGAVGGGLIGYELGRLSGENQQFRQDEMMMGGGFNGGFNNNGDFNNNGGFDNGGGFDNQNNGGDSGGGWVGQDSDFSGGDAGGGDFGGGGDSGGGGGDW
jgi:hypothetical protein